MKHTLLKNLFFTTLLLAFVVGCGKDGGGGSGGGNNNYTTNPINSGQGNENISSSAIQGYNVLVNWKNNLQSNPGQERPLMGYGRGYAKGVIAINNSSTPSIPAGCENIGWDSFPIYWCKNTGQQTQPVVTPISVLEKRCTAQSYVNNVLQVSYMTATSLSSSGCTPTGSSTVYNIANNTELNQLLSFQKGKILRIYSQYNGVYVIELGAKVPEGYSTPTTAIYTIDVNKHSIYNPIAIQTSNDQITKVYEAY
ncbi:hypothetical protein ACJVC5_07985 [Peredibacter sp. HCB2-198]|uniref:hypothetical protein n=1 Tax=Peredibacter sp. HCB2-198 TaxID=3383025 RepID=UPI0038B64B85